jgi:hypothetical protein
MKFNKAFSFTMLAIAVFSVLSCGDQKKQPQTDNQKEVKQTVENKSVPDSVIVTVSLKGKRDRLNILQQKVMLMAKRKLADSLIKLQNMHSDTSAADPNDYEVSMHDMHVMKEGLRYPDKNNQEVIEAYITLGIKYAKN